MKKYHNATHGTKAIANIRFETVIKARTPITTATTNGAYFRALPVRGGPIGTCCL